MEITSKRYIHDHVSSYKNRGEKLGCANRFVRAHRANEERKTSRLDELTKRRGLLLSLVNECNLSLEENPGQKKITVNANNKAKCKGKSKSKENEPPSQATDERKAMLLKWREQRELKRKTDAAKNQQKAVFAVRHVQHDNKKLFTPFPIKKTTCKASPPKKPKLSSVSSAKSATRSSARLANKQIAVKSETKGRPASNKKETVASKKVEEVPKRVTRQSTKAKTISIKEKKDENNLLQEQAGKQNSEVVETEKKATPVARKNQQQKSFAPPNFQFTGPSGLYSFEYFSKDFKFQPLSPASTDSFFQGITPASATPENCRQLITKSNFMRTDDANSNENPAPTSEADELSTTRISLSNEKDFEGRNKKSDEQGSKEMDCEDNQLISKYFRGLVSSETEKLNFLCEKWEKEMELESDLPEEARGNIRTAIGQAQLLISQRFKQFCGLIDLSEDETAEKKATMSDLQGFWDMIYFQVEDVHTKMGHLEKQKEKNWIAESKQVKTAGKKTKKKSTTKSAGKKAAKPTGKSKIQEMRAAMRAKMAEKKRQMVAENGESCSFITVLTPLKKTRKSGSAGSVVLTPVRRSLRNAPISKSGTTCVTPNIISTPKRFGNKSPGLRLTPEALTTTPSANGSVKLVAEKMEDEQESSEAEENKWESLSTGTEVNTSEEVFDKENGETNTKDTAQDVAFLSAKKRSCLRTSTKKKRKSSRVYFQSPQSCDKSTAGGTPGTLVLTPGVQGNAQSTGITTPVAVSFDSPSVEGSTCSLNAGHTPAMAGSRKGSLRKRASNGTSVHRCSGKHTQATPEEQDMLSCDSATEISSSPVVKGHDATPLPGCLDNELTGRPGSKSRALRRSCRKSKGSETECFLPDKYILPSTSSEDDCDDDAPETSPVLVPKSLSSEDQALVAVTPSKNSSNRLNQLSLTPATLFQALSINDPPSDATRRDSVFFARRSSLLDNGLAEENLICFSPVTK